MFRLYREDLAVSGQQSTKDSIENIRLYREDLAVSGQRAVVPHKWGLYREDLAVSGQQFRRVLYQQPQIIPRGFGGIRTTT